MRKLTHSLPPTKIAMLALTINALALGAALAKADIPTRLEAGSVIPVRLNETLSSNSSQKGDTFTATVRTGQSEDFGLPSGTKIDGLVKL